MDGFQQLLASETGRHALNLAGLFARHGGRALLVGGCVRDAILRKECKDIDLEVYGLTSSRIESIAGEQYALNLVGSSFGVFKVEHLEIDIALPRLENKTGAGHRGFRIEEVPDLSFAQASARRDFTINAMMYDPLKEELIDPWHGSADLKNGILRHVSDHFQEDPLRVLRCMQFAARFNFKVAPETVALCRTIPQGELPFERLAGEWEKLLLKGIKPSAGLNFLRDCGWIDSYPELKVLIGCRQTPQWHPEGDVWNHTLLAMDALPDQRSGNAADDLLLALAVLCHDFGKPDASHVREDGAITSYEHETMGLKYAKQFVSRLWKTQSLAENVCALVKNHMKPFAFVSNHASDRAYRRLALEVGRLDLLRKVCICDLLATLPGNAVKERLAPIEEFYRHAQELALENQKPKPILLGRHLLSFGIAPGQKMGELLKTAFEAQLDGAFSDEESGIVWLKQNLIPQDPDAGSR